MCESRASVMFAELSPAKSPFVSRSNVRTWRDFPVLSVVLGRSSLVVCSIKGHQSYEHAFMLAAMTGPMQTFRHRWLVHAMSVLRVHG